MELREKYEMPQFTIVEMEVQSAIMDPTVDGGGNLPELGE